MLVIDTPITETLSSDALALVNQYESSGKVPCTMPNVGDIFLDQGDIKATMEELPTLRTTIVQYVLPE